MKRSLMRRHILLSLAFGVVMGAVFPLFASIFTEVRMPEYRLPFVALCVLAGIVVGFVSYLIGRATLRGAIVKLRRHLQDLVERHDLTTVVVLESADELGEIADQCNTFSTFLRSLFTGLKGTIARSAEGHEIAGTSYARAADELVAVRNAARATAESNEGYRRAIDAATREMEQISSDVHGIVDLACGQESSVGKLVQAQSEFNDFLARLGAESRSRLDEAQALAELAERGRGTVDSSRVAYQRVQSSADAIRTLVASIRSVAEDTNVLAVNAAIEASRAGEHGRGFGVLSAEIRALSDQTREQAASISGYLDATTESVATLSTAIDALGAFGDSVGERTLAVRSTFGQIVEEVSALTFLEQQIGMIASELQRHSDEIRSTVEHVDERVRNANGVMDETSATILGVIERLAGLTHASNRLHELFSSVHQITERTGSDLAALAGEVAIFRVE